MGHSKFHNTSYTFACYRPRSDCSYSLISASGGAPPPTHPQSLPPFLAKAGTCARDRRALQQLATNVHVKHSDLTWPDLDSIPLQSVEPRAGLTVNQNKHVLRASREGGSLFYGLLVFIIWIAYIWGHQHLLSALVTLHILIYLQENGGF